MKLSTIWTLPAMSMTERMRRTRDALVAMLAHRLPRRLAYYSFIDTGARHMASSEIVPEALFMTLLARAGDGVER